MDQKTSAAEMLRALLQWKRGQLKRADVGLPPRRGARRFLTQEDVAELIGYSARVVIGLENGRFTDPSHQLLEALVTGLRMSPDERRQLWLLAAGAMPPPGAYATGADVGLTRMLEQIYPHPAYVTDAAWGVVGYNRGVAEWFVDFDTVAPDDRNIAKWIFLDPHARHAFGNWAELANQFLARMRAVAALFPGEPVLGGLIEDLKDRGPEFRDLWDTTSSVHVDEVTVSRSFRRPGHTDPTQADDAAHQVPVDMTILAPLQPGDERRLVTFMLPPNEPHRPHVLSTPACAACHRAADRHPSR